jgi:TonB family protein
MLDSAPEASIQNPASEAITATFCAKFFRAAVSIPLKGREMNTALVYRPNNRGMIWVAFGFALAIHLAAVALGENKSKLPSLSFGTELDDVVLGTVDLLPQPPEQDIVSSPGQIPAEDQEFTEENAMARQIRPRKKIPIAPVARSIGLGRPAVMRSVSMKAVTLYAPRPSYPYEARRNGVRGSGVVGLTLNSASGEVIDARMSQSTGSAILDHTAVEALRRWRFRPGVPSNVTVPITYALTGVSY